MQEQRSWMRSLVRLVALSGLLAWETCLCGSAVPHLDGTGWHDEFNTLDDWAPWTGGGPDVLRGDVGKLTVVLGRSSMYMSVFRHYRAGVYRDIDVDLDRYPVLAVRALRTHRIAQWDVQVFQYRDPNAPDARDISKSGGIPVPGNPAGLAADTVAESKGHRRPGVVLVDVMPRPSASSVRHVRLMLNVSGPEREGYADFAWVRFLTRQQARHLRVEVRRHRRR